MYSTCSQDTTPTHTRMCIYICIYSVIHICAHIGIQHVLTRLKMSERAQARASKKRTGRPYIIYIYYVHKRIYIYVYIYICVCDIYVYTHAHTLTHTGRGQEYASTHRARLGDTERRKGNKRGAMSAWVVSHINT